MDEKLKEALASALYASNGEQDEDTMVSIFVASLKASGFAIVPRMATDTMKGRGLNELDGRLGSIGSAWWAMIAAFEGE